MRSEHRAPLAASIVVVVACGGVMAHGIRTDALTGLARLAPLATVAAELVAPKPGPAPSEPSSAPVAVATPRAVEVREGGSGRSAPVGHAASPAASPAAAGKPGAGVAVAAVAAPKPAPKAAPASTPAAEQAAPAETPDVTTPAPTAPAAPAATVRPGRGHGVSTA